MKRLPVVRTGDAALDRFLDAVRQYIESGELAGANRVLRVADIPAIAAQSQASYDAAAFETIAKGVLESKAFQSLTSKINTPFAAGDTKMTLVRQQATESVVRANNDSATAELVTTVASRVDDTETGLAAVVTTASTSASKITGLEAQYTVKVMAGGAVAGYGLSITANNAAPSSAFTVAADRFSVVKPDGSGTAKVPFSIDTGTGKIKFTADVAIDGGLIVSGTIDAGAITSGNLGLTGGNMTAAGGIIFASGSGGSGTTTGTVTGTTPYSASALTGVRGDTNSVGGQGVFGYAYGGDSGSVGVHGQSINGAGIRCTGNLRWGSYTWVQPDGTGTKFLCADGTWAAPAHLAGYPASSWFRFISTTTASKTFVGYANVDVNGTSSFWIPVYS